MENNSFLKSLNWDILKVISDDENESDDTLIENNDLIRLIKENIVQDSNTTKLAEQLSQVDFEETNLDSSVNEIKRNNDRDSYIGFSNIELSKHIQNKNYRESYFGFSDMDVENQQNSLINNIHQHISDLDNGDCVGKTDKDPSNNINLVESNSIINVKEIETHLHVPISSGEVDLLENKIEYDKNTNLAENNCFESGILEGLTENLDNISEKPFSMFIENNNYNLAHKPCSPPLTLCTGTRRRILPAEKKLPNYNKKQKLTVAVKQLPVRKCASYYIEKSNRKPVPDEKENSLGRKQHKTYSSDEEIELLENKCLETTQSKHAVKTSISKIKCNKNHLKVQLKPKKELRKKIKNNVVDNKTSNKELMGLLEIEEHLKSLELKVTGWLNGSETISPSREQAFQMLTDTNILISQLQQKLEKKYRKNQAAKIKEKKFISLLLDRSKLLALTIDNAIVEADRLMEMEHLTVESGDVNESSQSSQCLTESSGKKCSNKECSEHLKPILKNYSSCENSTDTNVNTKHISFSDDIQYHFLSCSDTTIGNSLEISDETKAGGENTKISPDNKNMTKITIYKNNITHIVNSDQTSKSCFSDEQLVTEVSKSKSDLSHKKNHSQVLNEAVSVHNETLETSFRNLTKVRKDVETIITTCSDDNKKTIVTNQRSPMTSQVQQSEKEHLNPIIMFSPIAKVDLYEDVRQIPICSLETKTEFSINKSELKNINFIDNKQSDCKNYIDNHQLKNPENSNKSLTKQINQRSISLLDINNSRDVSGDNTTCYFISNKPAESENSFGFSETESDNETWTNISIMNVKAIRVKDQEECIPISNLSSDLFESVDWFEGLEEWGNN